MGFIFLPMRYHYEKPDSWTRKHGEVYACDHVLYSRCTLYRKGTKGLAVIQERFNPRFKCIFYGPIDPWLVDEIYLNPKFDSYFDENSGEAKDGVFPTVEIRKIMWALRMKPLKQPDWVPKLHLI